MHDVLASAERQDLFDLRTYAAQQPQSNRDHQGRWLFEGRKQVSAQGFPNVGFGS